MQYDWRTPQEKITDIYTGNRGLDRLNTAASGWTFGGIDELRGGVGAGLQYLQDPSSRSWERTKKNYQDIKKSAEKQYEDYYRAFPSEAFGTELASSLMLAKLGLLGAGKLPLTRMQQYGVGFGGYGAMEGALRAEEGKRLEDALKYGLGSAALGYGGFGLLAHPNAHDFYNQLNRTVQRPFRPPVLGTEVANPRGEAARFLGAPLDDPLSIKRFETARAKVGGGDTPYDIGQGAWQNTLGNMEYNPVFLERMKNVRGGLLSNKPFVDYATSLGRELNQDAAGATRVIPDLINTKHTRANANAVIFKNMEADDVKKAAGLVDNNKYITSARPNGEVVIRRQDGGALGTGWTTEIAEKLGNKKYKMGNVDPELDSLYLDFL
mgnify:FL=1|tara:strand:+ start:11529 stop:12668 length:1140 start_codon:yes stop_codon:yes gene_type:complete